MLQSIFKKTWPHLLAIGIFLIVAVLYCLPALEGEVLQQHDIVHWKGMAQNSFEYKEKHGHFPLWNTTLFSGMPAYQVALQGAGFLADFHTLFTLGLPIPIAFFFLACLCFYILSQVLRVNYLIGILASLAFAYATYDPVIIVAGHESKMWAMAYMPGVLAGLILIYNRKYLIGLAVTAVFATWQIGFNHPQVSYYFFLSVGIITLGFLVQWIREKQWKHTAIAISLSLLAGFVAFANASIILLTTREYAEYTMRGGKTLQIQGDEIKQVNTTGLDLDYAFSYSAGKDEFLTFFMPDVFGGSSSQVIGEDKAFIDALAKKNIPEANAIQIGNQLPRYWGGIVEGTSGPVYLGAIVFFLAIIGLVIVRNPIRWWILGAIVLTIFIAWGKYFSGFNTFLYNNLPLFKKFRAHSMALIIPQLLMPVLAAMALQRIFFTPDGVEELKKSFKKILYAVGGVFVVTLILYFSSDFSGGIDQQIIQVYTDPQTGDSSGGRMLVSALEEARKSMFTAGMGRALLFAALVVVLLFLYMRNLIKPAVAIIILLIVNTADLLVVDSKYLNRDSFMDKDSYQVVNFAPNAANQTILQDTDPHYRVYNLAPDRFNDAITSYFHRSVGGYHAAKLVIYQELIEGQLSKFPLNMGVLNMLDTRYLIIPPGQQNPTPTVQRNDGALGAAWFVKAVQYVDGPVAEMKALDNINPKDSVVIDKKFADIVGNTVSFDSAATISLVKYDNDTIQYATNASTDQIAVFSEIYYPAGWNAYIDGKKADYAKVNYVLRGMRIPAGQHTVEFRFEPKSYRTGVTLTYIGNGLLWLFIALGLWGGWRSLNPKKETAL